jgi:hypothetical protein
VIARQKAEPPASARLLATGDRVPLPGEELVPRPPRFNR